MKSNANSGRPPPQLLDSERGSRVVRNLADGTFFPPFLQGRAGRVCTCHGVAVGAVPRDHRLHNDVLYGYTASMTRDAARDHELQRTTAGAPRRIRWSPRRGSPSRPCRLPDAVLPARCAADVTPRTGYGPHDNDGTCCNLKDHAGVAVGTQSKVRPVTVTVHSMFHCQ